MLLLIWFLPPRSICNRDDIDREILRVLSGRTEHKKKQEKEQHDAEEGDERPTLFDPDVHNCCERSCEIFASDE